MCTADGLLRWQSSSGGILMFLSLPEKIELWLSSSLIEVLLCGRLVTFQISAVCYRMRHSAGDNDLHP